MRSNLYYPLVVWFIGSFLTALVCAIWPVIRLYPITTEGGFEFRAGFFFGVFAYLLDFSMTVFVFLSLLYYLLVARFYLSERFVKSALIFLLLIAALIASRIDYPGIWFHPLYIAYSVLTIISFLLFRIYTYDLHFED